MKTKKGSAKAVISDNIKKIKTAAKPKRSAQEVNLAHAKIVESRKKGK